MCALATYNDWNVYKFGHKISLFEWDFHEELYVLQFYGLVQTGQGNEVYSIFKALYGLKQESCG